MSTFLSVFGNYIQNTLDFLFQRIIRWLKKILFLLLHPFLYKEKNKIEGHLKESAVPEGDALKVLKLASISNDIGVEADDSFEAFYLEIPAVFKKELSDFRFLPNGEAESEAKYFSKLLRFLSQYYLFTEEEAKNLISGIVNQVASQFLEDLKAGKQKSNNKMFGVDQVLPKNHSLLLKLFITDYFTFKCINRLYEHLMQSYSENDALQVRTIEDVNRVSPFLCNFGLGGFLSLNLAGMEVYFIGKRSSSVACPNVWQTSFDETFDLRDRPNVQGEPPSLKTCLERGVKEELGLSLSKQSFLIESSLLSVIQTKERFELEVFIIGHCIMKSTKAFKETLLQMYSASDFENENEIIQLIPKDDVGPFYRGLAEKGQSHTDESHSLWTKFMAIRDRKSAVAGFICKLEPNSGMKSR